LNLIDRQRIERRRWHTASVDTAVDDLCVGSDLIVIRQIESPHHLAGELIKDGRNVVAEGNCHRLSPLPQKGTKAQKSNH
jgi:hypothetical protein